MPVPLAVVFQPVKIQVFLVYVFCGRLDVVPPAMVTLFIVPASLVLPLKAMVVDAHWA